LGRSKQAWLSTKTPSALGRPFLGLQSGNLKRKAGPAMKNLSPTIKYVALTTVLVASIIILSCVGQKTQSSSRSKVTIQENGILIRPGTKLSESDDKAMNDILKNYDKSLYKIQTYEKGQLKRTQGSLRNVFIDKATASAAAKAMAETGSTQYVIQIGFLDKTHQSPTPPVPPRREAVGATDKTHQGTPTPAELGPTPDKTHQVDWKKSEELIKRLTPILEKYSGD
jgi:hypothetical protein